MVEIKKIFADRLKELGIYDMFIVNLAIYAFKNELDTNQIISYCNYKSDWAGFLLNAFNWNETKQGGQFWYNIAYPTLADEINEKVQRLEDY